MNTIPRMLIVLFICSIALCTNAQHIKPKLPADRLIKTIKPQKGTPVQPVYFLDPAKKVQETHWNIDLDQKGSFNHKVDLEDELQALKAKKNALKKEQRNEAYPAIERSVTTAPVVLSSFEANEQGGWSPPDNDMAISDDGYIVSVVNSAVNYFDSEGNSLVGEITFSNLFSSLGLSNFLFDPKVMYDPVEDKFIMVCLSGNTPEESNVIVGFSVSQNPMDGWHFYTFGGSWMQGNWFDYPNWAISDTDLIISGNLFNGGFDQVAILQIDKTEAFTGGTVEWEHFNNVQTGTGGGSFNVVPAEYPFEGSYGPGIFMVSNRSFGGGSVVFYEITDEVGANQELNAYNLSIANYESAGDAQQLGANSFLDTGGSRIRNATYADGTVHFVFTIDYQNSNWAGFRYCRVDVDNLDLEYVDFGQPGMDIAYPTVVPFGMDETTRAMMIGYLNSNANIYPQMSVVMMDGDMNFSEPTLIKSGDSPMTSTGESQRWGDYSGGGIRLSADYPNVWFVGCYGKDNGYGNWIYEVSDAAAGEAPIANFEMTPRQVTLGESSIASSLSINGAETFEWTFEDGIPTTSTEPMVEVTYNNEGIFDVQLIVSNEFGSDTLVRQNYMQAFNLPVSDFTADVTVGEAPLTVNFENLSQNVGTSSWVLSGATPGFSTETNPTAVYENEGSYTVSLVVGNDSGSDVSTKPGFITVSPSTNTIDNSGVEAMKVFPNPIADDFRMTFHLEEKSYVNIYLINEGGQRVKRLLEGNVRAGENEFSFSKGPLAAGVYFLVMEDELGQVIKNEKIIVSK